MLSFLERHRTNVRRDAESGLTVLELMIVVVIVGLLAAVSIPIFMNQQKNSIEATLKSDLRNAASTIMTEAVKTQGRMPAWLPNYATKSPDNSVIVNTARSNQYVFCLQGTNPNVEATWFYSSLTGQIGTEECPSVTNGGVGSPGGGGTLPPGTSTAGLSFDEQIEAEQPTRKALLVAGTHHDQTRTTVVHNQLRTYNFDEVVLIREPEFVALTPSQLNEYYLIVTYHTYASTPLSIVNKLVPYYEQGGKVLQDGNDNEAGRNPFIDTFRYGVSEGAMAHIPTKNTGLSPSFPYTFSKTNFYGSDSGWRCIKTLKNGGVSVAEFISPTDGSTCITVYGGNNSSGGRWLTHHQFITLSSGVGEASVDWLLS